MPIKMIVTDLDNTLLRYDKSISDRTVKTFARLRERGILTLFATSRAMRAAARFRKMITPDIDIASGGAIAVMKGKTLYRAAIDMETATAIIHDLKKSKEIEQITVDTEDFYFDSKPLDPSWTGWVDYQDTVTTDFSAPLPVPDVFKITPRATNAQAVPTIAARYKTVKVLHFTGEDWYQITSCLAAKQYALAEVCRQLGIHLSEVVAFDDDHNDIAMLRECGTGVAVANAIPEAKAAANYLCDSCEEDGVAKWVDANL